MCKHGFTGDDCEESNILRTYRQPDDQKSGVGVIVAVILVSIIFIAIVVLVIFYYRRRVSNLKTEIAHVQYISDAAAFPPGEYLSVVFIFF